MVVSVNRRDFLLLRAGRDGLSVELSCERLLMKYLDAQMEGSAADLFARLDQELAEVRQLRLVDTEWLARDDLKGELARVLDAFRGRGGRLLE